MKRIANGVWVEDMYGAPITVNENLNTISTVLPGGKEVKVEYEETLTTENYACFRRGVEEAMEVYERLKIPLMEE